MSIFGGLDEDGDDLDVEFQVFCGMEGDKIFKDKLCV